MHSWTLCYHNFLSGVMLDQQVVHALLDPCATIKELEQHDWPSCVTYIPTHGSHQTYKN